MIITISGAGCTGKTTILNKIQETLASSVKGKKILCYGEFIRMFFDKFYSWKYKTFEDLLEGDPVDVIDIHKDTARYFNEVLWSANHDDILVFDRSPIDISIYLYMNLANHLNDGANSDILEKYRAASRYIHRCSEDFMRNKPIILYTRPFKPTVDSDGFRPVSLVNRRELELSLFDKEFLSSPDVHVLPSNLDDRVSCVKNLILSSVNNS